MREIAVRHLQAVIETPERDAVYVADTAESTARRRVRLKHDELLLVLLRDRRGVEQFLHNTETRVVRQIVGEDILGVDRSAEAFVQCSTIVVRVAATVQQNAKDEQ